MKKLANLFLSFFLCLTVMPIHDAPQQMTDLATNSLPKLSRTEAQPPWCYCPCYPVTKSSVIVVENHTGQVWFITVEFIDSSGDCVLFVGDWVGVRRSIVFNVELIGDIPSGFVGWAVVQRCEQVDYPNEEGCECQEATVYGPSGPVQESSRNSPSSKGTSFVAEPVNVVFGNYIHQVNDLSIPGRGLSINVERTYNSNSCFTASSLGYGWIHSYDMRAVGLGEAIVINEDGRLDRFAFGPSYEYIPPAGVSNKLVMNPDWTFTLEKKDQTRYNFNTFGRLDSIVDKNGNTISCDYDTDGNLTVITDTVGRTITLIYDADNRITQITDPAGRTITYGYL